MKFRTSIIISTVFHGLLFAFVPGVWFTWEKPSWVEVSLVTFPDMKEKIPDWTAGRKIIPEPALDIPEIIKNELPLPVEKTSIGIPVEPAKPKISDNEYRRKVSVNEDFEKSVPGKKERAGRLEGPGTDDNMVIAGPVVVREVLRRVKPKYPDWAQKKGIDGEVELKFWVSPEGFVTYVEMERTSGHPELDSRAMEALKRYLFSPLGKDEEQKTQWGKITIKYTLE